MSTAYRPETPVSWDDFFCKLPENIWIYEKADNGSYQRCLTDGTNYLWVFTMNFEKVFFEKYGKNYADDIVASLENALGVRILNEHHPDFGHINY